MTDYNLKIIKNGGSLSENDLSLLTGTQIILQMMRNRVIVVFKDSKNIQWETLTNNIKGLYHIRHMDASREEVYQIWFENNEDLIAFEKNAMISKLSQIA